MASTSGRTAWVRRLRTPLREFLRTETGGAAVMLAAAVAALVWVNASASSYEDVWGTRLSIEVGGATLALDFREWVNSGLMTFFFFGLALETRREFDIGELRERRRFALPLLTALGGIVASVAVYVLFNGGRPSAGGWGIVLATDTAFALGVLAVVGPRSLDRLRAFMLTVVVVDDIVALVVIATVYTDQLAVSALLIAAGVFGAVLVVRALGVRQGIVYAMLGAAAWVALLEAGVEPALVGFAMGFLVWAYPVARADLERAGDRFRAFREQPTPEFERSARASLSTAISPNDRLQQLYQPWSSYVIVPLFALANAGIAIDAAFLERALTSPITLGIVVGYVVGRPIGFVGSALLVTRASGGRLRPPVGWAAVAGGGVIAGLGFTLSLLIATVAFDGRQLEEAKAGILTAAVSASLITWLLFRAIALLRPWLRVRALLGTDEPINDLYIDVDPGRDHIRGPIDAPVTIVEYGDFECPYCGRAEPEVPKLLRDFADVRFVWRHLPLSDVHPNAELAAEASEAAAAQGAFWPMHDLLLEHQHALQPADLVRYAEQLGLDVERFTRHLDRHAAAHRIDEDIQSADLSGVTGTPTFFVNGRRHYGAYDTATLSTAVRQAGARAALATALTE